jgi:hypothetical protein
LFPDWLSEKEAPDRAAESEFPAASRKPVFKRLRLDELEVLPATVRKVQLWAESQNEFAQSTVEPAAVVPKSSVMPAPEAASRFPPTEIRSNWAVSVLVLPKSSQTRLLPLPRDKSEEKDICPGEFPAAKVPFTVLAPPMVPDPFNREPLATLTPPASEPSTVRVP